MYEATAKERSGGVKKKYLSAGTRAKCKTKQTVRNGKWTHGEKESLAHALKTYGFGDTAKIAEEIGTRTEADVKYFIEKLTKEIYDQSFRNNPIQADLRKLFGRRGFSDINFEQLPPIALWTKAVSEMAQKKNRLDPYTVILVELFNKFAEEEAQYAYEDLPDLQSVYKYFASTLNGDVPPVLSKTSNLILSYLYQDGLNFLDSHDWRKEEIFFRNFTGPTRFRPMTSKVEKDTSDNEMNGDDRSRDSEAGSSNTGFEFNSVASSSSVTQAHSSNYLGDMAGSSSSNIPINNGRIHIKFEEDPLEGQIDAELYVDAEEVAYNCRQWGPIEDIPSELFDIYKLHEKFQENLNPMMVPSWILTTKQEEIKKYFDDREL